jgi:hypothetical protein
MNILPFTFSFFLFLRTLYIPREEAFFFFFFFFFLLCFIDNGWVYAARFTWCFDGGVYKWAMMSLCILRRWTDLGSDVCATTHWRVIGLDG